MKLIDTEELAARVASLLERTRRLRASAPTVAGKLTTLLGAKGGSGTPTLTVNLGVALALRKLATAACELRAFPGSAGQLIGVHASRRLADLLLLPTQSITPQVVDRRMAAHTSGLRLLCAPQDHAEDRVLEADQAAAILDGLGEQAAHRLVNLPPAIGTTGRIALERSN